MSDETIWVKAREAFARLYVGLSGPEDDWEREKRETVNSALDAGEKAESDLQKVRSELGGSSSTFSADDLVAEIRAMRVAAWRAGSDRDEAIRIANEFMDTNPRSWPSKVRTAERERDAIAACYDDARNEIAELRKSREAWMARCQEKSNEKIEALQEVARLKGESIGHQMLARDERISIERSADRELFEKAWRSSCPARLIEGGSGPIPLADPGPEAPPITLLVYHLAQLRHLYAQMIGGYVVDTAEAARGLLGPAIEYLERVGAGSYEPAPRKRYASPFSRIARLRIALQEVVDRSAVLHSLVYSPEVWTPDDDPSSDLGSGERAVKRLHASLNRARAELAASYAENVKTDAAAQEKELDRG